MDAAIARPRRRAQAVTSEESWKQKVSISEQFRFRRGSSMTSRGSPSRFLTAVLHNGVGRYVRQLQRLQLLFSPTAADSRGARQFVEEAAMDFARRHPDVVLYVSPRSGQAPVLLAEYLNGTVREELIASKTSEEIVQLATKLAGQSGLDIIRIRKPFHTDNPSIQGQWHPLTNKPSALNVQGPRLQPK